MPVVVVRPLAALRRRVARWGLAVALAALPVYYTIFDLTSGYPAGFAHGSTVVHHDLTRIANNLIVGLSNGAIWALIAIGYTLVYGIIELINFAHGEAFMIGSFVAVGFWGSLGPGLATGTPGIVLGLVLTLLVTMLVGGSL